MTDPKTAFWRAALDEARRAVGVSRPNPAVGCVITRGETIVGRGRTQEPGGAHAEVMALRNAKDAARGAEAWVTLEPCTHTGRTPPCVDALREAGVKRVHAALRDPNPLVEKGRDASRRGFDLVFDAPDAIRDEAFDLMAGFFFAVRMKRPLVTGKWAMTLDGRTATSAGTSRWISGTESRAKVQDLRRRVEAILVGVSTVVADGSALDVKTEPFPGRQPLRVVLDPHGRTPLESPFWTGQDTLLLSSESSSASWRNEVTAKGADLEVLPTDDEGRIDPSHVLRLLADRKGINHLLCEGGSRTLATFQDANLLDRSMVFLAPKTLSDASTAPAGMTSSRRRSRMSEALGWSGRWTVSGVDAVFEGVSRPSIWEELGEATGHSTPEGFSGD